MTSVALLTREFPPEIYGGAGVHVEYLSRELSKLIEVGVYCFGKSRDEPLVRGAYEPWLELDGNGKGAALRALSVDLHMAQDLGSADVVHSHTWYANFAGYLAKVLYGSPHVMTSHSLEPLRPWKKEQLGPGYALSCWVERTAMGTADAVIAVSAAMAEDVKRVYPEVPAQKVRVVHNGIDAGEFAPGGPEDGARRLGVDTSKPYVLFVGRITRQKGITYLLEAAKSFEPGAQVVFCVGAPDTPELEREVSAQVEDLARSRPGVLWVEEMLPRPQLVQLISHSSVFVCPSIYEPFGLINVEAMACGVPVVASAVGGVPEIVAEDVTGHLVHFEPSGDAFGSPADPGAFALGIADRVNQLLASPERAREMGAAGRERVLAEFTWAAVAAKTVKVYEEVLAQGRGGRPGGGSPGGGYS